MDERTYLRQVQYLDDSNLNSMDCDVIRREARAVIRRDGALHVAKATGRFIARSPIQSRQ